jgi:hypothetical protein
VNSYGNNLMRKKTEETEKKKEKNGHIKCVEEKRMLNEYYEQNI